MNGWVCLVQRRNLVGLVEQNARGGLKRKSKLEELVKATTAAVKPFGGTEYTEVVMIRVSTYRNVMFSRMRTALSIPSCPCRLTH